MTTVDELREEIRDLLDVHESLRGGSQLRSRTLESALEQLGRDPWGGAPSMRVQVRDELGITDTGEHDASGLRKPELEEFRDALEEARQ